MAEQTRAETRSRREMLLVAGKLPYVVPVVQLFSATAMAAGSGMSGPSCVPPGGLCNTDTDCCTGDCNAGLCQ